MCIMVYTCDGTLYHRYCITPWFGWMGTWMPDAFFHHFHQNWNAIRNETHCNGCILNTHWFITAFIKSLREKRCWDLRGCIPRVWSVTFDTVGTIAGVPDFVERLHSAAKVMQERTRRGYHPNILVTSHTSEKKESNLLPNVQQYC